jgi:hypothetical protein
MKIWYNNKQKIHPSILLVSHKNSTFRHKECILLDKLEDEFKGVDIFTADAATMSDDMKRKIHLDTCPMVFYVSTKIAHPYTGKLFNIEHIINWLKGKITKELQDGNSQETETN